MNPLYLQPSLYAHIMNGLLLLVAIILLYKNYSNISQLEPYKRILVVLLFSAVIGIHGLSHYHLENGYNYNPIFMYTR